MGVRCGMVALLLLMGACGRMDYEEHPVTAGAGPDAGALSNEGVSLLHCPEDMRLLHPDGAASFCINVREEGIGNHLVGEAMCADAGKRFCQAAEWDYACVTVGPELEQMIPSTGWEWVAEVTGTSGHKRADCDTPGTHAVDDGDYGIRCCQDPF